MRKLERAACPSIPDSIRIEDSLSCLDVRMMSSQGYVCPSIPDSIRIEDSLSCLEVRRTPHHRSDDNVYLACSEIPLWNCLQ
jgi:hypothetical protein